MICLHEVEAILDECCFKDWTFVAGPMGDGFFIQVKFRDEHEVWSGRKWYVSSFSVRSEVVQTAFKAVITAVEHEVREHFLYRGQNIFQPHYDVQLLVDLAKSRDVRERRT